MEYVKFNKPIDFPQELALASWTAVNALVFTLIRSDVERQDDFLMRLIKSIRGLEQLNIFPNTVELLEELRDAVADLEPLE